MVFSIKKLQTPVSRIQNKSAETLPNPLVLWRFSAFNAYFWLRVPVLFGLNPASNMLLPQEPQGYP
jgi:hypothetical protein